ncbi:hypothetical protein BC938DRAFT_476105 [Jimgerdemannia flammicorona]|uniref:Uncharacterized protein n=1 Tax=Jimgerdemannia flammicorona TaxID=994334 RepID=A0A433QQV9_9FUNG|nr:hypothetical protein BC938DRAFT_476105 [Jimgerdemannia flammicorona]
MSAKGDAAHAGVVGETSTFGTLSRSRMIESAPLQRSTILPSGNRTTMDMRFLLLENSTTFNIWNSIGSASPGMRTLIDLSVFSVTTNPRSLAADTSAYSSGDAAWYVISPVTGSCSGTAVWHNAMASRNQPDRTTAGSFGRSRMRRTRSSVLAMVGTGAGGGGGVGIEISPSGLSATPSSTC